MPCTQGPKGRWLCYGMGMHECEGNRRTVLCARNCELTKICRLLENYMLPSKKKLFGRRKTWLFQQDNAPCHKSRYCMVWFSEKNVPLLLWPARSPDLNVIENVWNEMERIIMSKKISTIENLKVELAAAWRQLGQSNYCARLVQSMPNRVRECYKAKGATKY